MKKIFSLFAAVLFAGSMFAAGAKVTLDFTDDGWGFPDTYTLTEESYTNGGYTITFSESNNGHKYLTKSNTDPTVIGIIMGKADAALTFPAMSFNVSKILVYYASSSGSTAVVHNIYVGSSAVSDAATGCKIEDGKDAFSTFNIASANQAAGNVYVLKVTSKHNMQISKVEFYEAVAGAPENPTFSIPAGVYDAAQSVALACATEGATIHYTLDGTDPTDASAVYSTPIAVAATTTIKAIAIKNSISSAMVSGRFKIVSLVGDGSEANPYTVADVIALENSRPAAAWVKGYIIAGLNGSAEIDNTQVGIIALGATADADEFIPVQLVNNTDPRAALNVVDNPGNIGKLVKVHGTLEIYCTKTGVKGTDDFEILSTTAIDNTAVENKAVKTIENGMIVIEKNGVRYNVIGQVIR